jgi:uncharacterized protein (DUF885 family)
MKFKFVLFWLLLIPLVSFASDETSQFNRFVDSYLDDFYHHHPVLASTDGIHTFDDHLDNNSEKAIAEELASLKKSEAELSKIDASKLPLSDSMDYQLVLNNIRLRRLELERIGGWRKNPAFYSNIISNGMMWIALYDYAPAEERLQYIISREREIPRVLDEAKNNIKDPPAVFVKVGLASLKGTQSFIENDIPKAFAGVTDSKLIADFKGSTQVASKALTDYIHYVEKDLQPKAKGEYAIGSENYSDKLKYQDGISLPLDQLLAIAQREIAANQQQFKETAAKIDPNADLETVWSKIKHDHPAAGQLVPEAQKQLETLISYIDDHKIVTIPKAAPVLVAPTPGFMRWSFASMWNPGPFETKDIRSPYYITEVDPTWNKQQKEEHLTEFNYPQLWTTSIHEAYPGHYVQGLYVKNAPSKVRKASPFAPGSYVEGWAHYCEQMMIDDGFGGGDPKIRMGQLKDALLRLCRFYVGISLHTRGMTVEQGTAFFMKNAYMEHLPAERETERGTFDPTYLVYSVGKLEILKLRDDYKQAKGDAFTLQDFHDRLLQGGNAPLWVYRKLMLPKDDGVLLK